MESESQHPRPREPLFARLVHRQVSKKLERMFGNFRLKGNGISEGGLCGRGAVKLIQRARDWQSAPHRCGGSYALTLIVWPCAAVFPAFCAAAVPWISSALKLS